MRPNGLSELTLVMCAFNATAFLFLEGSGIPRPFVLPLVAFSVFLGYVVLWYFWEGRNWARWLVLITSVLTLLNLFTLPKATPLQGAILVMKMMLGGFLLYWLNTAVVRGYFTGGASQPVAAGRVDTPQSQPLPSIIERIGMRWIVVSVLVLLPSYMIAGAIQPGLPWRMLATSAMGLVLTLPSYIIGRRKNLRSFGARSLLAGAVVGSIGGTVATLLLTIVLTVVATLRNPAPPPVSTTPDGSAEGWNAGGLSEAGRVAGALTGRWAMRVALAVPLLLAVLLLANTLGFKQLHRIDDRAGVLDRSQVGSVENHLAQLQQEMDVDIRVFVDSLRNGSLDEFAARKEHALGITRERRLLLFYDMSRQQVRIEVGPALQGIFPSAFVAFLTRSQVHNFFESGDPNLGMRLALRIVRARLQRASLGEEYDPRAGEFIERLPGSVPAVEDQARRRFGPQPTVKDALDRNLEWLLGGRRYTSVPLFTKASQAQLARLSVSRASAEFNVFLEYGQPYDIVTRGNVALLYFTADPLVAPHFFRRGTDGWQVDVQAEAEHIRVHTTGPVTWSLAERDDDITRAFIDRYTVVGSPLRVADPETSFLRIAGGDNRLLRQKGDEWADRALIDMAKAFGADTVFLPPDPRVTTQPEAARPSGLTQLTVSEAAERIAAAKGKPTVVLIYDVSDLLERDLDGSRYYENIFAALRRCQARGADVFAFSIDEQPYVLHRLPDFLRAHDAPFSAVRLYRWPRGQLRRALASLGIEMAQRWNFPMVVVRASDGRVALQLEPAFKLETRDDIATIERVVAHLARGSGVQAASVRASSR